MAIKLEALLDILGPAEVKIVEEAQEFVKQMIPEPNETATVRMYASKNVTHQELVSALHAQVNSTGARLRHKRNANAATEREFLQGEGYRSAGERHEMVYRSPSIRDDTLTVRKFESLAEYLNSLEWRLKTLMSILS